jgi:hypothetical protein
MAIDPKAYSYSAKPGAEYQRFKEEYYSGQDVRIYLGDIWVDEIVDLRFQLMENTAPIFGYASYTWDAVAKGNRQIQGTFRINFKESYYLHSILNQLDYKMSKSKDTTMGGKQVSLQNITADHLLSTIESVYSEAEFDKLATQFEQSLWSQSAPQMQSRTNSRGDQSFFAPEDSKANLAKNGFSILLTYGPYTQTYSPGNANEKVATTARSIVGVHLTGVSQVIDGSGQPVYEDYSFIARDIDSNVNILKSAPKYMFGKVVE